MQPQGRFRLVILDFDGTLADSWPWLVAALCDAAPRFGLPPLTAGTLDALRGQETRAALAALGVPGWQLPRLARHLRRRAAEAPAPPLFPGIPEMLQRLARRGVTLVVASSNTSAQIRRTLGPELSALFAGIAADAALFGKAARFRRILRVSGVPAAEAIAIGDETRDIAAAHAAGLAAGAVTWGYAAAPILVASRPDAVFDHPDAIARLCDA